MILSLIRHTANTVGDRNIIGDLFINGVFFCHTLEDEIRADGKKVKHETAIPAGKYQVLLTLSNRFKRVMPILVGVPMFEGIRMHGGNNSKHTSGCPLVAFNTDYKTIWTTAEKELTNKLKLEKEKVFIHISNGFLTYDKYLKKLDR